MPANFVRLLKDLPVRRKPNKDSFPTQGKLVRQWIEALPLANWAGGLVVGKFGTATVSYEELFA